MEGVKSHLLRYSVEAGDQNSHLMGVNLLVLRHIWGCFTLIETISLFSVTTRSLPYHTFAD